MNVILLQDISGVGKRFEVKNVAEGYAANFLFPRKLAAKATSNAIQSIEKNREKARAEMEVKENLIEKNLEALSQKKIVIKAKASEAGHLFAGIHKQDIATALKEQAKIDILLEHLDITANIKSVGVYKIPVKFKNKKTEFELSVESI